nr:MAG TPA: hypothetical protein [Microviridae sp.]
MFLLEKKNHLITIFETKFSKTSFEVIFFQI